MLCSCAERFWFLRFRLRFAWGAAAAFGRRGEATDHPLGTMGMRQVPKARRRGHLVFRGCFRGKFFAALFTAARRSAAPGGVRLSSGGACGHAGGVHVLLLLGLSPPELLPMRVATSTRPD
jgi:hypothetical protein